MRKVVLEGELHTPDMPKSGRTSSDSDFGLASSGFIGGDVL